MEPARPCASFAAVSDAAIFFLLPGSEGDAEDQRSPTTGRLCLPACNTSAPPAPTSEPYSPANGPYHDGTEEQPVALPRGPSAVQVPRPQEKLFI